MTLDQLHDGELAILVGYAPEAPASWRRRFEDLGFIPETEVRRERRAPLGDPLAFRLRGTVLCLRRAEARLVKVRRLSRP